MGGKSEIVPKRPKTAYNVAKENGTVAVGSIVVEAHSEHEQKHYERQSI